MDQIRIGGVPEHFNLPWHLCLEENLFKRNNLNVQWKDYPGGTGAMMSDLAAADLEVAVVLTEGAITAIAKGNPSLIAGAYVNSPLIWGIHVSEKSNLKQVSDLPGKIYAISRLGSGSHLMAFVDAELRNWDLKKLNFLEVKDLQGARKALSNDEAQVFMWEKFMTKPLVDAGEFRRVGERPTPWPSFIIVVRKDYYSGNREKLKKLLDVIYSRSALFQQNPASSFLVADRYQLKSEDAAEWFSTTKWAGKPFLSSSDLFNVSNSLFNLGLISEQIKPEQFCVPDIFE